MKGAALSDNSCWSWCDSALGELERGGEEAVLLLQSECLVLVALRTLAWQMQGGPEAPSKAHQHLFRG